MSRFDLVGDVGGTNARFALTDPDAPEIGMIEARSLPNAGFASLQHAIEHYLAQVQVRPRRAAIAVASPVDADEIRLTNRAWSFSRAELQRVLALEELRLLNDFGAVAWAVPTLKSDERVALYGPVRTAPLGPISVIGPGTGLGVGLLVGSARHGWHVVETEGGHVSFAPLGEEEEIIARWLTARFGRASTERVLSGDGLSCIDAALRGEEARPPAGRPPRLRDPADIVAAALDGHDHAARRALARFCAVFGSVAGDAALIHGARSVMIAGGIVPRFISFLRSSAFRERFLAKGRFAAYLEAVSVEIVTHRHPGLLGAAAALRHTPATEPIA
ncbi:MAG: glucokinase [Chiayiivirga sp.]|jgi:glucokinase|uniref:glucokinase n=1 Tax=Chiayiivirga sp. TaxID=2041042 RepID=UPI0025BC2608|nr:glucokinase [Chiayiivirga sp.]MCI1710993.1 glucokinase [Chiayiivirga sp.]MCI1728193.1 glucokinase [Chiayiivirga sp.]